MKTDKQIKESRLTEFGINHRAQQMPREVRPPNGRNRQTYKTPKKSSAM